MVFLQSAFLFFNDTATTEIYTLSLHDALPICLEIFHAGGHVHELLGHVLGVAGVSLGHAEGGKGRLERTEVQIGRAHVLNSSHANISYAVFCLKKKKDQPSPRLRVSQSTLAHQ